MDRMLSVCMSVYFLTNNSLSIHVAAQTGCKYAYSAYVKIGIYWVIHRDCADKLWATFDDLLSQQSRQGSSLDVIAHPYTPEI